jgi:hypothetical protein
MVVAAHNSDKRICKESILSGKDKPKTLAVLPDGIPAELRALPQWVTWKWERNEKGRWTKVPYQVNGRYKASTTERKTWGTFAEALATVQAGRADGVGFVFTSDDAYFGADIDDLRNPETGELTAEAQAIIGAFATYTDVSPTETGVKLVGIGTVPTGGNKTGNFEAYHSVKFFTLTGHRVEGTPAEIRECQAALDSFHKTYIVDARKEAESTTLNGKSEESHWRAKASGGGDLADDGALLAKARGAKNGYLFTALYDLGDTSRYASESEADLALVSLLAFYTGPDPDRIDRLFRGSRLMRPKWERGDYRSRTIKKALSGMSEFYGSDSSPKNNGAPGHGGAATELTAPWEEPIPLGSASTPPPFPAGVLPEWMETWVIDEAVATQTPPDLAALLVLAAAGAGIAGKCMVEVRSGWEEPCNLLAVVALPRGERKTTVFNAIRRPIQIFEREEQERMRPAIAAAESRKRVLENQLKAAEQRAAKRDLAERPKALQEADTLAKELAEHQVPERPRLFFDDITPEALSDLLCRHGGRMFQAADEGTAFEIAKGRYSETANFDVYLKGHAGSPLRNDRVGRGASGVDAAYLSAALAVQPDVLQGLHDEASMRGRGFLARWLYAVPQSTVGGRQIAAPPVPAASIKNLETNLTAMWKLEGGADQDGSPQPHVLRFAGDADHALRELERWLEPKLADGAELFWLAGWANKLAGAVARIAGILHVAEAVSRNDHEPWKHKITRETVERAIRLGRDYLLPHAMAAFGMMDANEVGAKAKRVLERVAEKVVPVVPVVPGDLILRRRDIHHANRHQFQTVDELEPVLKLLESHGWIRPTGKGKPGRGHPGPSYAINPAIRNLGQNDVGKGNAYAGPLKFNL